VASLLTVGHIGVALFYVLSGFLNAYHYAAKAREGGRRFLVQCFGRRIARIYPLYLFLLLVTFAATTPLPDALTAFLNVTLLLTKGLFLELLLLRHGAGAAAHRGRNFLPAESAVVFLHASIRAPSSTPSSAAPLSFSPAWPWRGW
jgi:peptidoglycan/LPS O-acetylase OafA/YrhL